MHVFVELLYKSLRAMLIAGAVGLFLGGVVLGIVTQFMR